MGIIFSVGSRIDRREEISSDARYFPRQPNVQHGRETVPSCLLNVRRIKPWSCISLVEWFRDWRVEGAGDGQ